MQEGGRTYYRIKCIRANLNQQLLCFIRDGQSAIGHMEHVQRHRERSIREDGEGLRCGHAVARRGAGGWLTVASAKRRKAFVITAAQV